MANQTVGELNVTMNLELTKLQAQIDRANKRISTLTKRAHSDVAKMARNMNTALSTIGVGLSVSGIVAFGKSIIDLGGKITDVAAEAGIGTDAFQTMMLTASQSGVSMEQLAQASTRLRQAMQEAIEGNKQFQAAFSKLGLEATVLQRLAPERQFELIGQKMAGATNESEAFNAALEILGTKGGAKLTAFLSQLGTEGFDKLSQDLQNIRLSKEQLATLDEAGDKLQRIWDSIRLISAKGFLNATKDVSANNNRTIANPFGIPDTGVAERGRQMAEPRGVQAALQALKDLDAATKKQIATAEAASTAAAQYAAEQARQHDLARQLAMVESVRAKGLDVLSVSTAEHAEAIEDTWRGLSQVKDIGLSLEANKPFVFDPQKIDEASRAWERFEQQMRVEEDVDGKLDQFFGDMDEESRARMEKMSDAADQFQQHMTLMWANVSDRAAQSFADMVLTGEASFGDLVDIVARSILEIVAQLAIINPILNGIFGGMGGFEKLPTIYGYADGGRPPLGRPSLVGEEGPELFVPDSAGTILPAGMTRKLTAGGRGGSTYYIDATGADAGKIAQLEQMLIALNGSVERRAVGAVREYMRRSGGAN